MPFYITVMHHTAAGGDMPPYVGPGDVVPSAFAWWGLRAYASASLGTNAVRLRENGGNTEQDFATIAGGGLNLAAIAAFKGANSLFVTKLYDQSGNGHDLVQATAANQPPFTLSALGSLPAMDNSSAVATIDMQSAAVTQAQPFTASLVCEKTSATRGNPFSSISLGVQVTPGLAGANTTTIFAGHDLVVATADNAWHAFQCVFNGASSDFNVDGTSNIGDTATTGFVTTGFDLFGGALALPYPGYIAEVGFWAASFSGADKTAMNSNQHTYWGF